MQDETQGESPPADVKCAECDTRLAEGQDRVSTEGGTFCLACYGNLTAQLQQVVEAQSTDINYSMATVGALGGAAVGVVAWWGFTAVTNIAFGLVAVVIGYTVAKGATWLSGHKRSQGLQILSVVVSALAFFYASYLVNRTFILRAYAAEGESVTLPWLPSPELFFNVIKLGFGIMDVVFLGIVVWQAWRIPAPIKLEG